ncbi:RasGEF N-terminal motif [Rhizoctonia solani]|uniref:RasGEF N-terminal motif n=1 Tax=Rhizoctonia solani TaxID=456999 RepID=A0A8H7H581_9AGAM|nr:RasGEF N-terminal motif [Rhizoctonia solani]
MHPSSEDVIKAEIASADLSMAVDGSFVETTSSHAARELKKRLDQLLGVGRDGVRSPYALTITQSPSGARVYRVGFRPNVRDGQTLDLQALSPSADVPSGMLSPLTAINPTSTTGLHQRAATRTHKTEYLLPTHKPGYKPIPRTRSGSISTGRPSTSTWEAERVPLPDDSLSEVQLGAEPGCAPRPFTGPQYVRLGNTDLQIYTRTGDSDIFSSAMGWSDAPRDATREPRTLSERPFLQLEPGAFPFGRGVIYTKPLAGTGPESRRSVEGRRSVDRQSETTRTTDSVQPTDQVSQVVPVPPADTPHDTLCSVLKYPTGVFQVLQTYRGLPSLDALLESHDTPTARLSTTTSAVPENDPRFVIFGDLKPSSDTIIAHNRRKITKPKPSAPTSVSSDRDSSDERTIMAATIERWVAQLTSELNYDALMIFFLTYRGYVSANDLFHLLICRFHWALEPTTSAQDETVRRIVRVRSFIVFRFWLATFFQVDFSPNKVLRGEFTNWLNALRKSPMLTAKPDAAIIVQKLKKIVRECREAHVSKPVTRSPHSPIERAPVEPTPLNLHALRTAFEPSISAPGVAGPNDSDVDLVSTPILDPIKGKQTPASPPRKSSLALPFTRADPPPHSKLVPVSMPMHHGPLTRAFVNTMGRIGRWKRGLGTRSMLVGPTGSGGVGCVDPSAFDEFGLGMSGLGENSNGTEVVAVRGGVEEYLRMCGLTGKKQIGGPVTPEEVEEKEDEDETEDMDTNDLTVRPGAETKVLEMEDKEKGRDTPTSTSTPRLLSQFPPSQNEGEQSIDETTEEGEGSSLRHSRRASDATQMQLYASTLRESYSWLPETETISIDDADLSDSSSESEIVRRPPRRLPNRRDLEFTAAEFSVARTDSVSSLGAPSTVPSIQSALSASDPTTPDHTGGPIQAWQIDFLGEESDDEAGPGDAEAALQRLEGQIDAEEQRLRDSKVDKWLKRVQELSLKRAAGGAIIGAGGVFDLAMGINFEDEDDIEVKPEGEPDPVTADDSAEPESVSMRPSLEIPSNEIPGSATSPLTDSLVGDSSRPGRDASSSRPANDAAVKDSTSARVVSEAMSHPTFESAPRSLHDSTSHLIDVPSPRQRVTLSFKKGRSPKDTSFLLQHRSEVIAQNLSAVERGLFVAISFEELVMHNWGAQSRDLDITDWMQFRTDAAHHRIQQDMQKEGGKDALTSDVLAVRARFNLTANFVASEVVMAHPSQRVALVNKIIRIAWKLYRMNNFATLCAMITGITSIWVNAAMRRLWQGVGMWEMRLLKDLKWFTSSTDNFRFMRDAIMSLTHDSRVDAPSDRGSEQLVGCIPFLGIYLSELSEYAKLPDFIDPTRPEEPVQLDPITGEFGALSDPEVFNALPELPDYMSLRPLINVQKQRQIAGVVQALVKGQHMASACRFTAEQKVYSKCLRLKCVDAATMWSTLGTEGA